MSAIDINDATRHCVYCPTLCLHACPVSTAESNDAVSPWGKMSLARWLATGDMPTDEDTVATLYKCTGCDACQAACKHEVDVSRVLQEARANAVAKGVTPYEEALFSVPAESGDERALPVGVSGVRLYAAGFTEAFLTVARSCARRWNSHSEVVFASAEDVRCVREIYPLFDVQVSASVVLQAETADKNRPSPLTGVVAYHESCHLARTPSGEAVKRVAADLVDGELVELRWQGDKGTCCGASGAYAETSPKGAAEAARRVLENAHLKGAAIVLTGCVGCANHMEVAGAAMGIKVQAIK